MNNREAIKDHVFEAISFQQRAVVAAIVSLILVLLLLATGVGLLALARRGTAVLLAAMLFAVASPVALRAQEKDPAAEKLALEAALKTRLAYVVTGDPEIDATSFAGLTGLGKVLRARTAVEPGPPIGLSVDSDELAFFPLVYWPVRANAQKLPDATLARMDELLAAWLGAVS